MKTDALVQITRRELRALRMRAQCLAPRLPRKALADVVKRSCGVNAQLYSALALSLRARIENLSIEDVEASRVTDRTTVRTWCMRGTMHLLAADDIDWLLSAVAPSEIRGGWRWLEKRGGLEHERAEQVLDAAYKALKAHGAMTRRDLMDVVARKLGLDVRRAAAGVVQLNGLLGRVCFGPDNGADPTYVALDDWLGRQVRLANKPDHSQLARRYLRGYGPAAPRDFASWWGLPLAQAKAAWTSLEDELIALDVEGQTVWLLRSEQTALKKIDRQAQTVRLLPAFDTYLLGYHDRDFAVPPKYQDRVFHGGEIAPTILIDGCAAGMWRYESRGEQMRIKATPFSSFTARTRDGIAEEVDDIGRFFGLDAALGFVKDD
jgi:DNA glycosylase AlkZ-like